MKASAVRDHCSVRSSFPAILGISAADAKRTSMSVGHSHSDLHQIFSHAYWLRFILLSPGFPNSTFSYQDSSVRQDSETK